MKVIHMCRIPAFLFMTVLAGYAAAGEKIFSDPGLTVHRWSRGFSLVFQTDRMPRFYLDTDNNPETGYSFQGIGADYLVQDRQLLIYRGKNDREQQWEAVGNIKALSDEKGVTAYFLDSSLFRNSPARILSLYMEPRPGISIPGAINGPLQAAAEQKPNLNKPVQTSFSEITYHGEAFDVPPENALDFLDAQIKVSGNMMNISWRSRKAGAAAARVFLDTLPGEGYGNGEADFLIEGNRLYRYAGGEQQVWKWTPVGEVKWQFAKNVASAKLELSLIRPVPGRIRAWFRGMEAKDYDQLPKSLAELPVLTPGNLAGESDTVVRVSSSASLYDAEALTDGQVQLAYWRYAAWASAKSNQEQWVEFNFASPRKLRVIWIFWEGISREIEIQTGKADGWKTLLLHKPAEKERVSRILLEEPVITGSVRIRQPRGKGPEKYPQQMWIREIEIY